ncbi:MAG: catalase [Solirubrobacterales bacterium]
MATSPEKAMELIHARYGAHDGHRALHAKGVICTATFTATSEAARLTRAGHMQGGPVPTIARFSNGGGDPTVPDYVPDVRGLAVSFRLRDGSATDILSQTLPAFPFHDQEGFLAALAVSKPSLGALIRLPSFAVRYPKALAKLPEAQRLMGRRVSFAARTYYAFHAYKWIDADGGERFVRYRWLPTVDEPELAKDEVKRRGANYLFDELAERLEREPVRMRLEVTIAGDGDDPDDPSDDWPAERERLIAGTLEVSAIDPEADDGIVFDPMRVVDGIEPSGDPVLRYRPDVYTVSHARRAR